MIYVLSVYHVGLTYTWGGAYWVVTKMSIFLHFFSLSARWKGPVPLWIPSVFFRIELHITDLQRAAFAWCTRKARKPPSVWWLHCSLLRTVARGWWSLNINCPLCGVTLQLWPEPMAWKLLPVTKALNHRLRMMKMMMIMMTITAAINLTLITIKCSLVFLSGKWPVRHKTFWVAVLCH